MKTQPAKILFTIPNFVTAGSGREMLNVIERLDTTKFAPSVCVLSRGGALEREVERLGIPLLEAPFSVGPSFAPDLPLKILAAAAKLRAGGYAIWQSFNWSCDWTEPVIARLAGASAWVYTKKNMNWDRKAWHLRSFFATRVIARNETMLETFFSPAVYRSRAVLVTGGVDHERFSPAVPPRLGLRLTLAIPQGQLLLVSVAQLLPVKAQDVLLRAVSRVPGVHVVLAGRSVDAEFERHVRAQAESPQLAGRVHFLGHCSDTPALLAEADAFVLATSRRGGHEEGCPVALLEAMAAGKACIATDVAGSRDLIRDAASGLLVQPDDETSLAQAIVALAADPALRVRLGRAARARVEERHTLAQEAAAFQRAYEEILNV